MGPVPPPSSPGALPNRRAMLHAAVVLAMAPLMAPQAALAFGSGFPGYGEYDVRQPSCHAALNVAITITPGAATVQYPRYVYSHWQLIIRTCSELLSVFCTADMNLEGRKRAIDRNKREMQEDRARGEAWGGEGHQWREGGQRGGLLEAGRVLEEDRVRGEAAGSKAGGRRQQGGWRANGVVISMRVRGH